MEGFDVWGKSFVAELLPGEKVVVWPDHLMERISEDEAKRRHYFLVDVTLSPAISFNQESLKGFR